MEPILVFSMLIVLVGGTFVLWHLDKRRARRARVDPPKWKHAVSTEELRGRLAKFCQEHPALDLLEEHGHLLVTWVLPKVHPAGDPALDRTSSLELRLREEGTVSVFEGEGAVTWARDEEGQLSGPSISWDWDLAPDFVHRLTPEDRMPEPTEHSPHTMAGLVHPLRRMVLDAGWAWQPVIEMPMEDRPEQVMGKSAAQTGAV